MKKMLSLFSTLLFASLLFSQKYNINWGEEIKLKKGTADLDIVAADNTGIYFSESRLKMKSYFVIGASYGESIKLYKTDKNFGELYDKEYKKELKGLGFHSFQQLGSDLYLFATDYIKKEKQFKIYGAKIDKNSGDLAGDFLEIGNYLLESKKDDYQMKMTPIENGSAFLMVSNISNNDRVTLGVSILDNNFKPRESTIIYLSFNPGEYSLQDVKLSSNRIVLLGKQFEETQVEKKKRMVFKNYVMNTYTYKGKKDKEIRMEAKDRFIINGQLIEQPDGGILLAGFYSSTSKKSDLDGFFINNVNITSGELTVNSFKEINAGMLGQSFTDESDEDDETKEDKKQVKKAKEEGQEEDFPNEYVIRTVDINPADNSILITGEVSQYTSYSYTQSRYDNTSNTWKYTTYYVRRFINKDILVINADKEGNIRWLNDIPKFQIEEIRSSGGSSTSYGGSYSFTTSALTSYFAQAGGMPFYSSYITLINGNNLVILLNDHSSNNINAKYGDKVKAVYNFRKRSSAYGISIELATGKMNRKFIASNNDETILMPRHAFVVKNELYIPTWRTRTMAKTKLKFAKVAVN